jgi:hypothetical protein
LIVRQENPPPDFCPNSSLEPAKFRSDVAIIRPHLFERPAERFEISPDVLFAALGVEREHIVDVVPDVLGTAKPTGKQHHLGPGRRDLDM